MSFLVTILCQSFKLPMWLAPLAKLFCVSCYDLTLPSSFVICPSSFLSLSVTTFPLLKVASDSWVCAPRERSMCKGGYFHHITFVIRLSSFVILSLFRHTPPIAYGLRPITSSLFFRPETLFLPFFTSLYYIMSQSFIYPFYTNRPRFV